MKDSTDIGNMLLSQCFDKLSWREKEKYAKFHFDKDRRLYLLSRALLRYSLAAYINCDPKDIAFEVGAYGKPSLKNDANVKFNLTHSNGVAALAMGVADSVDIGIDIESTESHNNFLDMGFSYFSHGECKLLRKCSKDKQQEIFYKLWTLKEAYIKAIGKGLSIDLNSFAFELSDDRISVNHFGSEVEKKKDWYFIQAKVYERHILALAIRTHSSLGDGYDFQAFEFYPGCSCIPLNLKDVSFSR